MSQLYFYFDQNRCIGCNACVVACKDWNDIKPGEQNYRRMHSVQEGTFAAHNVKVFHVTYACNHCEHPSCLEACPLDAIFKRESDGVVQIDHEKCGGAGECVLACPYNAIHMEDTGAGEMAYKCTFCWERLAEGKRPSCVMSCPQRAIDCGSKEDLEKRYPGALTGVNAGIKGFPGDTTGTDGRRLDIPTGPSILFKVKR